MSSVSSLAPPSGYSDAGSFTAPVKEPTAEEKLEFLTHSATLANVRRRIAQKTGIKADLLRGVCVHGQLQMYHECGYDESILSDAAVEEEQEARQIRKSLGIRERGRFKSDLARVVAAALGMKVDEVLNAPTYEFRDLAVSAVGARMRRRRRQRQQQGH